MLRHTSINRRNFVKGSSTALAGIAAGVWTETAPAASKSPNEKLNIGCIGVGGKGWVDMTSVRHENICFHVYTNRADSHRNCAIRRRSRT